MDETTNKYIEAIYSYKIQDRVANFFESSVISNIPASLLNSLVEAINEDCLNDVFKECNNIMTEEQLNSKTHKIFMKIIKEYFGESAYKLLSERKSINIFNVSEIHVLHQEIFDKFGEAFVNKILNYDLTPQSLIIIKEILSSKDKMDNFEYFYKFFNENYPDSYNNFERMIRGYIEYEPLIKDIRDSGKELSEEQIMALKEIFCDKDNIYNIKTIDDVNNFYNIKSQKYMSVKNSCVEDINIYESAINYKEEFKKIVNALFLNFYGMNTKNYDYSQFALSHNDPFSIYRYFDIDAILEDRNGLKQKFTDKEIEMLEEISFVGSVFDKGIARKKDIDMLLKLCDKKEKEGNKVGMECLNLTDKLVKVFGTTIMDTVTKVSDFDKRIASGEKGIYTIKNPYVDENAEGADYPIYALDGADFSFVSSSILKGGLSDVNATDSPSDVAKSWFEYENGISHISCSYSNQEKLSNLEFKTRYGTPIVTFIFDEASVLTMGSSDVYTPAKSRVRDVFSDRDTKFMEAHDLIYETEKKGYNEVAIERYSYDGDIKFGGKIIPSAILCSEYISEDHIKIAENFSRYCVEKGLKPKGWKLPIVVVNKDLYVERIKNGCKKMLSEDMDVGQKKKFDGSDLLKDILENSHKK